MLFCQQDIRDEKFGEKFRKQKESQDDHKFVNNTKVRDMGQAVVARPRFVAL